VRRTVLFSVIASSVISTAVTVLVMSALMPAVVDAQVARLTAAGITIVRDDNLPGLSADVRPTGGGVLRILGVDGKTNRITLAAAGVGQRGATAGQAPGASDAGSGGLSVNDLNGSVIARVGTLSDAPVGVELYDAQGNLRYRSMLDADGNPTIQLLDADGKVVWSAP
jgi:hypothetical protein